MTANKRIVLNVLATYLRSLFGLICGLFTARWVLSALGHADYGLYGVVGGLTFFIAALNGLMAGATARFYAFSVGQASSTGRMDECVHWFNTALMIHTIIPSACVVIGYPCGLYCVEHVLAIPADRLSACVWVYRSVVVSCFIAMLNVPFQAMYMAKQKIAELTIYSFAQTTLNFFFFMYMANHPGDWLVRYAFWMCLITSMPQVVICIRAIRVFPECRFRYDLWWQWKRVRQMWSYAGWNAFAGIGSLCRNQGLAILINRCFGSTVNAAMSVANQVSAQAQNLTMAMQGAFTPAVTSACGAGDMDAMRAMAFRACKFGSVLVLIFIVPLFVEMPEVMRLWLRDPPPHTVALSRCMLAMLLIDKISIGQMLAVNANGKVAGYQAFCGTMLVVSLPLAWLFVAFGMGVPSIGFGLLVSQALSSVGRVWFARRLVGMGAWRWTRQVLGPISLAVLATSVGACLPQAFLEASLVRIIATTLVSESILLPVGWLFVLDGGERRFIKEYIMRKIRKR